MAPLDFIYHKTVFPSVLATPIKEPHGTQKSSGITLIGKPDRQGIWQEEHTPQHGGIFSEEQFPPHYRQGGWSRSGSRLKPPSQEQQQPSFQLYLCPKCYNIHLEIAFFQTVG